MYISRRQLEAWGEPIGDMSHRDACGRAVYHGGGKGGGDAPDYTPMAQASEKAAAISAEVSREYLEENKRQYDENMAVAKPIIDSQVALSQQAKEQGDDYYNYMVSKQRPVEDALNDEAMTGKPDAATQTAMDEAAAKATADARTGTTQQANMIARQGIRYGMSPDRLGKITGGAAVSAAQGIAGATDAARTSTRAQSFAKRMDVAGLYRGLPGASQGAYSLATNAGNSAVNNKNQTSAQYMGGVAQGNNYMMQGQQMRMQGLSSILNSQTSVANSSGGDGGAGIGAAIGGVASIAAAFSDRRLKDGIELVGIDEKTGLNLYEFSYIGDSRRFVGVMADEVEAVCKDAVSTDDRGFSVVDYGMLGIEMREV